MFIPFSQQPSYEKRSMLINPVELEMDDTQSTRNLELNRGS